MSSMKYPPQKTMRDWQKGLKKNGARNIKIRRLLKDFGVSRRTEEAIREIRDHLESQEPKIYAPRLGELSLGLDTSIQLSLEDSGQGEQTFSALMRRKRRKYGKDAVASTQSGEQHFMDNYLTKLLKLLKLEPAVLKGGGDREQSAREFSPKGTRDKLDVICVEPKTGDLVALEFKVHGGDRRGVEQLLRYTRQLADTKAKDPRLSNYKNAKIRGVLVTGVADQATREAVSTLDPYEIVHWHTYTMGKSRGLSSVVEQTIERQSPVRPLYVQFAKEVAVMSGEDKKLRIQLRSLQVDLAPAAARRLKAGLENAGY